MDRHNFGVVGLANQITHLVNERLLRQMTVQVVAREALAVFAVDVHAFAGIVVWKLEFQTGQHDLDGLKRIGLEKELCWPSGGSRGRGWHRRPV